VDHKEAFGLAVRPVVARSTPNMTVTDPPSYSRGRLGFLVDVGRSQAVTGDRMQTPLHGARDLRLRDQFVTAPCRLKLLVSGQREFNPRAG
jgi:hypothetical protein